MLGRKYVVCRLLWAVGCVCNRLGMGPGLGWISPHNNRRRHRGLWEFVVMLRVGVL